MSDAYIPHRNIRDALQGIVDVPAVTSLAVGGVVDKLPKTPRYAIVRIVVRGRPVGPIASSRVWECEAEIDIYSTYEGTTEAMQIANVIVGLLDFQPLTVDGWTVIEMSVQDLAPVEDELIADDHVGRWQIPVLIHAEKAA